MFVVVYTVRMVPDVDWAAANAAVKKWIETLRKEQTGCRDIQAYVPLTGLRRAVYLMKFDSLEASWGWYDKLSDKAVEVAKALGAHFVPDNETDHWYSVE